MGDILAANENLSDERWLVIEEKIREIEAEIEDLRRGSQERAAMNQKALDGIERIEVILTGDGGGNGIRATVKDHDRRLQYSPPEKNKQRLDILEVEVASGFRNLSEKLDSAGRILLAAIAAVGLVVVLIELALRGMAA